MDNRESGRYDPNINNHPPTCTCAECTNRRLGKKKQAIWSNLRNYLPFKRPESEKPSLSPPKPTIRTTKTLKQALGWLIPTVLIFSCTLIGFGISLFIGTTIPLWLLLGFSLIISIEKWLHYATGKYKYVGKLYRLFLNLSMLCLLGLIIWSGIKLFSQQYFSSSLVGSLVFLAELVFFIWMWRTVSKNSWRWPSMKLTVLSLICLFLIFAFAGVPPMSDYKDSLITEWNTYWAEQKTETSDTAPTEINNNNSDITSTEAKNVNSEPSYAYPTESFIEELTISVYTLVNNERTQYGLRLLVTDSLLTSLAVEHSEEMVLYDYFSHERMAGSRDFDWGMQPGTTRGENLSYTPERKYIPGPMLSANDVAEWAVSGWMESPGHRDNILNNSFFKTGISISYSNDYFYITQIFEGY